MEKQVIRQIAPSLIITLLCVLIFYTNQMFCFEHSFSLKSSLLFHFSHANIFHLAINIIALWSFKPRFSTCFVAYVCSSACSIIPFMAIDEPTCGLSGLLFAAFSRKYYFHQLPLKYILTCILIGVIIPLVNWRIHLSSFLLSYVVWMIYDWITVLYRLRR